MPEFPALLATAVRRLTAPAVPAATPSLAADAGSQVVRAFTPDGLNLSAAAKSVRAPLAAQPNLQFAKSLIKVLDRPGVENLPMTTTVDPVTGQTSYQLPTKALPPDGKLGFPEIGLTSEAHLDWSQVNPISIDVFQSWFAAAVHPGATTLDAGQLEAALPALLPGEHKSLALMIDNLAASQRALASLGVTADTSKQISSELADLTSGKTPANPARQAVLQRQFDGYNAMVDDRNTLAFTLSLTGDMADVRSGKVAPNPQRDAVWQRQFDQITAGALARQTVKG